IRFFVTWNSGNNTTANICIVNQNTIPAGNDFGLDDITFIEICDIKAIASSVLPICNGSTAQLSASGGDEYIWSPAIGLSDPNIANPIASPTVTTQYKVIARKGNCIDSSFVNITVNPLPTANAGNDTSTCLYTPALIGAPPQAGMTYSWTPSTGLSNANISQTIANTNTTTTYILQVTDLNGCSDYDTVVVTVFPLPIADAGKDKIKCPGESTVIGTSSEAGILYSWTPTQGLSNPYGSLTSANPDITTSYILRATNLNGCENADTVVVTVDSLPAAKAGTDTAICKGDVIQLGILPKNGNTYSWKPTTGLDNPTKSNPLASPIQTTMYILTVANANGCIGIDSVLVSIRNITAKVSRDTAVCLGSSVQLSASGGDKYLWSPSAGLNNPAIANPICTPDSVTLYKVIVTQGNCLDSAFVTVGIAPDPIADAGKDTIICIGGNALIGVPPIVGSRYTWKPATELSNPNESQTLARPTVTSSYVLRVVNETQCVKEDTVLVEVYPIVEAPFTLSPSAISMLPGQTFKVSFLVVEFDSILEISKGITASVVKESKTLSLQGKGENGDILLRFNSFLPQSTDTAFSMNLTVDSATTQPCIKIIIKGSTLALGEFCGKGIRMVQSTGKSYYLKSKENGVNFGVGLSGKVRLELYDYMGALKEVLADASMEAGEYSIDFNLPIGVYFCRISSGMYDEVRKVMVLPR
ncbi:MAG: hypothetical protein HYZ54_06685, partial [Ignavibacteriae bacterium]|nr:hypothetical protein [Ignavibacteriota bacterium]